MSYAQVIHIDVDRITRTFTERASAYETSLGVMSLYVDLMKGLKEYDALLFFIGGDNFMGLADGVTAEQIQSLLLLQESRNPGMKLKCGMGVASTGRKAAELATGNLEKIRETDRRRPVMSTVQLR
jgi:GTP cyclohydrolase IIa